MQSHLRLVTSQPSESAPAAVDIAQLYLDKVGLATAQSAWLDGLVNLGIAQDYLNGKFEYGKKQRLSDAEEQMLDFIETQRRIIRSLLKECGPGKELDENPGNITDDAS